jgi:predicted alpha/beta-fold hydrolase
MKTMQIFFHLLTEYVKLKYSFKMQYESHKAHLAVEVHKCFQTVNKQDIIDTYIDGQSHGFNNYKDGEDYYNKVFKDK